MQTVQRQMCSDLNHPLESAFFIRSRLTTTSYLRQKGKASMDTGEANNKRYVWLLIFLIWFWNGIPKYMEKPSLNCSSYYITQWTETFVSITRCQKRWSNCDKQVSETFFNWENWPVITFIGTQWFSCQNKGQKMNKNVTFWQSLKVKLGFLVLAHSLTHFDDIWGFTSYRRQQPQKKNCFRSRTVVCKRVGGSRTYHMGRASLNITSSWTVKRGVFF